MTLLLLAPFIAPDGTVANAEPQTTATFAALPAPDWSSSTLDGRPVDLQDLRGTVVLLNVWATWCGPCLREMPALEQLNRHFSGQDLQILGVSVDRKSAEDDVRSFVEEVGVSFTILLDADQEVMSIFHAIGVPETFLIDRAGTIVRRWTGEFDPLDPAVLAEIGMRLAEAR